MCKNSLMIIPIPSFLFVPPDSSFSCHEKYPCVMPRKREERRREREMRCAREHRKKRRVVTVTGTKASEKKLCGAFGITRGERRKEREREAVKRRPRSLLPSLSVGREPRTVEEGVTFGIIILPLVRRKKVALRALLCSSQHNGLIAFPHRNRKLNKFFLLAQ